MKMKEDSKEEKRKRCRICRGEVWHRCSTTYGVLREVGEWHGADKFCRNRQVKDCEGRCMWAVILTNRGISAEVPNCIPWNMDSSNYCLHWICHYYGSHSLISWMYYMRDHVKKPGICRCLDPCCCESNISTTNLWE